MSSVGVSHSNSTLSSILQHGRYLYSNHNPLTLYLGTWSSQHPALSPSASMMTMAALPGGVEEGGLGARAARRRTLLLSTPALPAAVPAKRNPLGGLWQHLLVFVFGPRDDMSEVMVGDQPSEPSPEDDGPHRPLHNGPHHPHYQNHHRHHMSPILVAPTRGQTGDTQFDFVVTAPTPPITSSSGSSSATSRTPDDVLGTTTSGSGFGSGFDTSTTLRTATVRRAASDRPQYLSPSRARREPRHKTISDVTAEARKVLEQLILRHDADAAAASGSTLLPLSAGAAVRPRVPPTTSGDAGATSGTADPTGANAMDEADGGTQRQSGEPPAADGAPLPTRPQSIHRSDAIDIPDDDDATSHEPVSGPNSTYSFSSRSSSHRNRIHLMTQITDEAQLKRAAAQQQQRKKKKKKRKVRRIPSSRRRGSTSSSSSSEYEIVDGQLRLRPKKSLFKRAKERLRQSFRRKKEPFDPYSIDDEELRQAEAQTPRTGNSSSKRPFRLNFRQQRAQTLPADRSPNVGERGFHSDAATSTHNGRSYCPVHDVRQNGSAPRDAATTPGDKDKNRSFLDNIIRTLRRGGERLRRRASHRETSSTAPPRSRSADAFTAHSLRRDADPRQQRTRANNNRKSAPQEAETSTRGAGLIYCRCQSLDSHVTRPRPPPLPALGPTVDDDDDVDYGPGDIMGHTSLTGPQTLRLQGLDHNAPRQRASGGRDVTSVTLLQDGGERHLAETDELDGVDQVADSKSPAVVDGPVVHTPFAEKTDQEKDELFEKIAEQLAAIADNYNLESPRSMKNADLFFKPPTTTTRTSSTTPTTRQPSTTVPKSASAPLPAPTSTAEPPMRTSLTVPVPAAGGAEGGAEGGARGGGHTPIEQKIGRLLRDKGDKAAAKDLSDFQPVVSELVRNASYSRFQQIIHENVGSEPGWQQVALVFNLTRSAVQLAGLGTAAALQIKELTLRYFEDRFAGWIVGQGGWESMVEDTDLSSEVD